MQATQSDRSVVAQEHCPNRVVFVVKETEPERWISNGGDFTAYLKPPTVEDTLAKVMLCVPCQASY